MNCSVIGWVDAWTSPYKQETFTENRRKALIERIRKREYNFTYDAHQTLPFAAPFYNDGVLCVLTRNQWNDVIAEAYGELPLGQRLMPADVIETKSVNGILFEKPKFQEMFLRGDDINE